MTGEEIANLVYEWADKQGFHPDDFDLLFAQELLERLKEDV